MDFVDKGVFIILVALFFAQNTCRAAPPAPAIASKTPAELLPITTANIRGHVSLYREGWFVVSSTDKALKYAKERSIVASGAAMQRLQQDLVTRSQKLNRELSAAGTTGVRTTQEIFESGTHRTQDTYKDTHAIAGATWEFGSDAMASAWHEFIRGNLSLAQRTAKDRAALAALPGNYFTGLHDDFTNLRELTERAKAAASTHIEGRWQAAYREAEQEFSQAYTQSGTRNNSLVALGDILSGYLKVLYSGVVKPTARSTVQAGEVAAKAVAEVVFLPAASAFIISGRTVQSLGLSLYYTTSTGVSLVAPTVEGGLLAGLSLLAYGATPVVYIGGGTLGAINQVTVTAAAPLAGIAHGVVKGGAGTFEYAALVSTDVVGGATKVALNQVSAGVALGYNALTALPTQLALGAANSVVFLAWDGPRLILAAAKGEVRWNSESATHSLPVQSLPVGSVVDLQSLSKSPGIQVETLSDDPDIVHAVLEKLPADLRVEGQP
ncbi:MAG: hypothetical protein AABY83_13060 [Pseudomonadota bacterium]